MDVEGMRQVEQVLDAVLTRDPAEWHTELDAHCSGDPELRREVESLLEHVDTAQRLLDAPPAAAAAALIGSSASSRRSTPSWPCSFGSRRRFTEPARWEAFSG